MINWIVEKLNWNWLRILYAKYLLSKMSKSEVEALRIMLLNGPLTTDQINKKLAEKGLPPVNMGNLKPFVTNN